MKDILFVILVIVLIPVYVIIWLFKEMHRIISESLLGEIFSDIIIGIRNIVDNMIKFWAKVFNKKQ